MVPVRLFFKLELLLPHRVSFVASVKGLTPSFIVKTYWKLIKSYVNCVHIKGGKHEDTIQWQDTASISEA